MSTSTMTSVAGSEGDTLAKDAAVPWGEMRPALEPGSGDGPKDGPMFLPSPPTMPKWVVEEAQKAHSCYSGDHEAASVVNAFYGWAKLAEGSSSDLDAAGQCYTTVIKINAAVRWLVFSLRNAHHDKRLKEAFLRIVGRCIVTSEQNKRILHAPLVRAAQALAPTVAPGLEAYYVQHKLRKRLARIKGPKTKTGGPLHQGVCNSLFSTEPGTATRAIRDACETVLDLGEIHRYEITTTVLAVLARGFADAFTAACAGLGAGGAGELRVVAPKTATRMGTKWTAEHEEVEIKHRLTEGSLNLDVDRVGIESADADHQLVVWDRVKKVFPVLRVKNLFTDDAAVGDSKLRFILINVLFKTGVTFREWVGSPGYEAVVERDSYNIADGLLQNKDVLDAIGTEEIALVCEIQLHLSTYVAARKHTHLWFKVERSPEMMDLMNDCRKFAAWPPAQPSKGNRRRPRLPTPPPTPPEYAGFVVPGACCDAFD